MPDQQKFLDRIRAYYVDKNLKSRVVVVCIIIAVAVLILSGSRQLDTKSLSSSISFDTSKYYTIADTTIPIDGPYVFNQEKIDREIALIELDLAQLYMIYKRNNRYMPEIRKALDQSDIHPDFQYIPMIESALRNTAVSSVGAAGIWQFMPATARRYGLIVTNTIDQRYDPTLATQAAVAYIQDLYDIFGDRLLVAAAYNRGESGLQRDLDRQFVDNYFDAILNNETARYIFRRAAMKYTYENIDRYFSADQLDETYEYPDTNIITINGPIDNLVLWASDKGYNYYQLRQLNPRIRTNQLPDGRWDIEVFSGI